MTVWLIETRDPLIFRDGRPFDASPGARAKTLGFPMPSNSAGAVRTRAGRDTSGRFDTYLIEKLKEKQIRGPLLVELDRAGNVHDWLFPTPADALLLKHASGDKSHGRVIPLTVIDAPLGAKSNLPEHLALVGPTEYSKEKPHHKAPAFWRWEQYKAWLIEPKPQDIELTVLGHPGPTRESRMHVSIKAGTQTAEDGALFQTSGLEFVHVTQGEDDQYPSLDQIQTLGLAIETNATLHGGLDFFGGEQRVVRWRSGPDHLPQCPIEVRQAIIDKKHCRLILATPALFAQGYLPDATKLSRLGVKVSIQAVANPRYQVVSGWDYYLARPKPARRLVPSGSVYFLQLDGSDAAIGHFVDTLWLQAVSDNDQDCHDGFGLALLGAWDGTPESLKYKKESGS